MTQEFNARFDQLMLEHFEADLPASHLNTVLSDLKLDSLGLLDFVMALEQTFDVEIDVEIVSEDMTLGEIREVLRTLSENSPAADQG
ncbi:MAG: acyl carrier protein [Azoarcus sp.]|nr:acyl carrier protein [Azoarcus sp.]